MPLRRVVLLLAVSLLLPACGDEGDTIINNVVPAGPTPASGDGSLVAAFDGDGVVELDASVATDGYTCLAIDAAGQYVYLGGYDASPANRQWRIEKREVSSGALVAAFDGDGVVQVDPSAGNEAVVAIAIDATAVYVAGDDTTGGGRWRLEKRDLETGALVAAFDGDGVVISDPSVGYDPVFALAVEGGALYAGGGDFSDGIGQWRLEKRDAATGALDAGFAAGGVLQENFTGTAERIRAVATDGAYLYLFGDQGFNAARIEKRELATGDPVIGFDGDGILSSDPTADVDRAVSVVPDPSGQYLLLLYEAGDSGADSHWRVEKRSRADGMLVGAFGSGGYVVTDRTSLLDTPAGIAMDADYLYGFGMYSQFGELRIEKRRLDDGTLVIPFGTNGVVSSVTGLGGGIALVPGASPPELLVAGVEYGVGNGQLRIEKRLR